MHVGSVRIALSEQCHEGKQLHAHIKPKPSSHFCFSADFSFFIVSRKRSTQSSPERVQRVDRGDQHRSRQMLIVWLPVGPPRSSHDLNGRCVGADDVRTVAQRVTYACRLQCDVCSCRWQVGGGAIGLCLDSSLLRSLLFNEVTACCVRIDQGAHCC